MPTCPDCGLSTPTSKIEESRGAPTVCPDCISRSTPEPPDGWPILPRWVSTSKGRGVFARRKIARGELIERCWLMPLPEEESKQSLTMPTLNRYLFPWFNKQRAIISGAGLLYNNDSVRLTKRDPNTECGLRRGISAIEFVALRDIQEGEELTWDYHRAVQKFR